MQDACQAPALFDPALYLAGNPDLRRAFDEGGIGDPIDHWRARGEAETRDGARPTLLGLDSIEPDRDGSGEGTLATDWYLALGTDLAHAFAGDPDAARRHWDSHGATEGRPGFGAAPPWARRRGDRRGWSALPFGCDLFVDVDPDADAEAVLGRRALAALRQHEVPLTVRAFTRRDGRLVLAREELDRPPTFRHALLAAPPAAMRLLLATFPAGRFDGQVLIGLLARAPDAPWGADWPVLATLDAVVVAGADPAMRARGVAPIPVHPAAVAPAPLPCRRAARRSLGLPEDAVVVLRDADAPMDVGDTAGDRDRGVMHIAAVCREGFPDIADLPLDPAPQLALDDRRDPWTGASLLLAAADHWHPGPSATEADRADAVAASRLAPPAPERSPPPPPLASVLADLLGAPPLAPECQPPTAPTAPSTSAGPAPVMLSVLVDMRSRAPAAGDHLVAALLASGGIVVELCLATDGPDGRCDWRVRRAPDLARASALATGAFIVPVAPVALEQMVTALASIASRLAAPDRPDALLALPAAPMDAAAGLASPLRDRIEGAALAPVAVRRAMWQRFAAEAASYGAAMSYAVLLAAMRDGARVAAVTFAALGMPAEHPFSADPAFAEAARRALRRHLRLTGRAGTRVDAGDAGEGDGEAAVAFTLVARAGYGAPEPIALIGADDAAIDDPAIAERHGAATIGDAASQVARIGVDLVLLAAAPAGTAALVRLRAAVVEGGAAAARFDVAASPLLLARRAPLLDACSALDSAERTRPFAAGGLDALAVALARRGERVSSLSRHGPSLS